MLLRCGVAEGAGRALLHHKRLLLRGVLLILALAVDCRAVLGDWQGLEGTMGHGVDWDAICCIRELADAWQELGEGLTGWRVEGAAHCWRLEYDHVVHLGEGHGAIVWRLRVLHAV